MISKNNKGEEVKAMIFPCVDDARFNQKKKEKKRQVRKGDSDGDSGDKKMRLRGVMSGVLVRKRDAEAGQEKKKEFIQQGRMKLKMWSEIYCQKK